MGLWRPHPGPAGTGGCAPPLRLARLCRPQCPQWFMRRIPLVTKVHPPSPANFSISLGSNPTIAFGKIVPPLAPPVVYDKDPIGHEGGPPLPPVFSPNPLHQIPILLLLVWKEWDGGLYQGLTGLGAALHNPPQIYTAPGIPQWCTRTPFIEPPPLPPRGASPLWGITWKFHAAFCVVKWRPWCLPYSLVQ